MHKVTKFSQSRPHDYMYDPLFTVPAERDQARYEMSARIALAQYAICPIFESMFSDNPHYPRHEFVVRNGIGAPKFVNKDVRGAQRPVEPSKPTSTKNILGAERMKFFKSPTVKVLPDLIREEKVMKVLSNATIKLEKMCNKSIQTAYRESSTQTSPWKPDGFGDGDLEILKLTFLKENLPAGMHEVEIIKRARRRRGWEKRMQNDDAMADATRSQILEAIAVDEWAFREQEIIDIQDLRYELLERMIQDVCDDTYDKIERKIMRSTMQLRDETNVKIAKLRLKKDRELRRLRKLHTSTDKRGCKTSIIEQYNQQSLKNRIASETCITVVDSEIVLDNVPFSRQIEDLDAIYEKVSTKCPLNFDLKEEIQLPGRRLCIRFTKWTEPVLMKYFRDIKDLNGQPEPVFESSLYKKKIKEEFRDETKYLNESMDENDEVSKAATFLQAVIRGRATQSLLYEGRNRCSELIKELQSTHVLISTDDKTQKQRAKVLQQQRRHELHEMKKDELQAALNKLQGAVTGTLLDFLNKELVRLLDERKAHAIALLAERERRDKEAAEAGRRQAELRRRREHDEMFRQVVKMHQDTVDVYLRDVITEGIEHASSKEAENYVKYLTDNAKKNPKPSPEKFLEKEELVANMVHYFLIPEIELRNNRQTLLHRQKKYLKNAHDIIYKKFNTLPKLSDKKD